jgi:hypothetical protein
MTAHTRHPALDSWGDYDRDDPFPLFAQVRAAGPVHEVRLADGHPAWLVVGHEQAIRIPPGQGQLSSRHPKLVIRARREFPGSD